MLNRNAKNYLKVLERKSVLGVSHSEEDNCTDDFTSTNDDSDDNDCYSEDYNSSDCGLSTLPGTVLDAFHIVHINLTQAS